MVLNSNLKYSSSENRTFVRMTVLPKEYNFYEQTYSKKLCI